MSVAYFDVLLVFCINFLLNYFSGKLKETGIAIIVSLRFFARSHFAYFRNAHVDLNQTVGFGNAFAKNRIFAA